MRGKWILFAGVAVLLAVAAGALSVYRQSLVRKAAPPPALAKPTPVSLSGNQLSMPGTVQAQRVVNVPAPIEGTVESYGADVGEDIFEGQIIAHIKNDKLETTVESASTELEKIRQRVNALDASIIAARLEASRARADASRVKGDHDRLEKAFERQKLLMSEGATPRLVFEKAQREYNDAKQDFETKEQLAQQSEARVDALNRELDAARARLSERTEALDDAKADLAAGDVRSPVDGIVLSRRGGPGDQVNRTMDDLFRIAVALSALEITIQPEPAVLPKLKVGQAASINVAEAPGEPISGTIRDIKEGRVTIDFTSPTPAVRPGLSAQVTIKLN